MERLGVELKVLSLIEIVMLGLTEQQQQSEGILQSPFQI
jgi:hypothetical protein